MASAISLLFPMSAVLKDFLAYLCNSRNARLLLKIAFVFDSSVNAAIPDPDWLVSSYGSIVKSTPCKSAIKFWSSKDPTKITLFDNS